MSKDILFVFGVLAFISFIYPRLQLYLFQRKARKFGCGPVITDHNWPFGLLNVARILRAWVNNDLLEYFRDVFRNYERRTGRVMVAGQYWMGTIEPENIKAVLATSFKDYSLGFRHDAMAGLLGDGIFTLSGEGWKHSRALLRPQFSREQVSHMDSLRRHINTLVLDHFASGEVVDAQVLFHRLTIDSASEFLFGESTSTLEPERGSLGLPGPRGTVTGYEFADAFTYALEILSLRVMAGPLWFLVRTPRFRRSCKICHNFIDYFVLKSLASPMEKDEVADRYVFINELTKETRDPKVIRDQAFNILLAGRDTTAALLSYTTFYLGANKDIYRELRQSILEEFGSDDREVTFEQLKQSKLLQNVVKEVLRLHPIVPLNFRQAIRDTKLPLGGGPNGDQPVMVRKGENVFYTPYAMQRDAGFWGPDADEFRPGRWNEQRTAAGSGWDYIPFNGGPRICLGQQFALTEASYTILRICQLFDDIELLHPNPNADQRQMKQWMRLTSSVADGVKARFHLAKQGEKA